MHPVHEKQKTKNKKTRAGDTVEKTREYKIFFRVQNCMNEISCLFRIFGGRVVK